MKSFNTFRKETITEEYREAHGHELHPDDQKHVLNAYVHRYTGEHTPNWVHKDARYQGHPHFHNDQDWLRNTKFRVKKDGRLHKSAHHCTSNPTWPNGKPNMQEEQEHGFHVMGKHTSVSWHKTKEEADATAKKMNYRGGTHYTVQPARDMSKSGVKKEETIAEKLSPNSSVSDYIDDFVHSKNKIFKGDSKLKRIRRALGAYYKNHR